MLYLEIETGRTDKDKTRHFDSGGALSGVEVPGRWKNGQGDDEQKPYSLL
jgi:hypothetical protein